MPGATGGKPSAHLWYVDRQGEGASDIWVSIRRGGTWAPPRKLGAGINSDGYDVFPFVSPDGRDLYFVRDFAAFYHIPQREALRSVEP